MKLMSCAILALFACPTVARAAPVVWNVQNGTFIDGGTLTGTFTYDAANNAYSNLSLSIAGGTGTAFTYTSQNSALQIKNSSGFAIYNAGSNRAMQVNFGSDLTDAGGTVQIVSRGSFDVRAATFYNLSGAVTTQAVTTPTAAVPEPATWAMMIGGFGIVGASMRRRATRVRFA